MSVATEFINKLCGSCSSPNAKPLRYENQPLCKPCAGVWGDEPATMTSKQIEIGMKAKFIDAMILAGWHYDDGCDGGLEFGQNNAGFIHEFTQCFFGYDAAFKFWCAAKMQATPPPF